jgi:hypothetical protein
LANQIWRDHVILEIKHRKHNRILYQIFETIRQDRDGQPVNYSVVQEAILSLGKENAPSPKKNNEAIEPLGQHSCESLLQIAYTPFLSTPVNILVALNSRTDQPLELYIEEFETPYIAQIKAYYGQESKIKLSSCSISQYMRSAIERLAQEGIRNSRYCHATSHARVCIPKQLFYFLDRYFQVMSNDNFLLRFFF